MLLKVVLNAFVFVCLVLSYYSEVEIFSVKKNDAGEGGRRGEKSRLPQKLIFSNIDLSQLI